MSSDSFTVWFLLFFFFFLCRRDSNKIFHWNVGILTAHWGFCFPDKHSSVLCKQNVDKNTCASPLQYPTSVFIHCTEHLLPLCPPYVSTLSNICPPSVTLNINITFTVAYCTEILTWWFQIMVLTYISVTSWLVIWSSGASANVRKKNIYRYTCTWSAYDIIT